MQNILIHVSNQKVVIPKHQIEFALELPGEALSKAALDTLGYLRSSISLQHGTPSDERSEAIQLFKEYGQELFCSIVPPDLQNHFAKEGRIYIQTEDPALDALPWEMLYDGASFCTLTQGVARILDNSSFKSGLQVKKNRQLKVALHSARPVTDCTVKEGGCSRFQNMPEEWVLQGSDRFSHCSWDVCSRSTMEIFFESLSQRPDLIYFGGFIDDKGWHFEQSGKGEPHIVQLHHLGQSIRQAVANGLRMLFLNSPIAFEENQAAIYKHVSQLFQIGIPLVLSLHGRMSRSRMADYFRNFFIHTANGTHLLTAHRHALNHLASELAFSWDWLWPQVRFNGASLLDGSVYPAQPFVFTEQKDQLPESPVVHRRALGSHRQFYADQATLLKIEDQLKQFNNHEVLNLHTDHAYPLEIYLQEIFRRWPSFKSISVKGLYYHQWGLDFNNPLLQSEYHLQEPVSVLFDANNQSLYLDQILFNYTVEPNSLYKFLIIYHPPENMDQDFDQWMIRKQHEGWKVIIVSFKPIRTSLPNDTISVDLKSQHGILNRLEDPLPEGWDVLMQSDRKNVPSFSLIRLAQRLNHPDLNQQIVFSESDEEIWKTAFKVIRERCSHSSVQTLAVLFLTGVKSNPAFVQKILEMKDIKPVIENLLQLQMIEVSLDQQMIWIPQYLQKLMVEYQFFPRKLLIERGLSILHHIILEYPEHDKKQYSRFPAFHICLQIIADLGAYEAALVKAVQLGKRLSAAAIDNEVTLLNIARTIFELGISSGEEKLFTRSIFAVAGIFDECRKFVQSANLLEWYSDELEKKKLWEDVANARVLLAKSYIKGGKKEKAYPLLTQAVSLNADLENYANRYDNLIRLSLLLIELNEYEKLNNIINHTSFDPELLSKKNLSLLWLIDSHLLYHEGQKEEAFASMQKAIQDPYMDEAEIVYARTYEFLAEMLFEQDQEASETVLAYLKKAAELSIYAMSYSGAVAVYEKMTSMFTETSPEVMIDGLKSLFDVLNDIQDYKLLARVADMLGKLYYLTGDQESYAHYYQISQQHNQFQL